MRIADKLFNIDGGEIVGMSSDFKDKAENIFYEAVEERASEESYLDGIEDVLENMVKHGMAGSAEIVEQNLIADGVIQVSGDCENEDKETSEDSKRKKGVVKEGWDSWMNEVVSMIG